MTAIAVQGRALQVRALAQSPFRGVKPASAHRPSQTVHLKSWRDDSIKTGWYRLVNKSRQTKNTLDPLGIHGPNNTLFGNDGVN